MSSNADLFNAAKAAMANTYSPYSKFPVGAAIRSASGVIYAGCNIENASFPEGWCAETSAIAHMVTAGEREISEILVMAEKADRATPCGGCRQRIAEFAKGDTPVHLCDSQGVVETLTIAELLPASFDLEA
ncbi:cytidine deaminase [Pseudahrensia aquimaris]|uniref:Cytidine deaminase n=1 Tax=Pseudahrensia aquimaris TaxID=744461 RepID=A0ABW3FJ58_9HYPH